MLQPAEQAPDRLKQEPSGALVISRENQIKVRPPALDKIEICSRAAPCALGNQDQIDDILKTATGKNEEAKEKHRTGEQDCYAPTQEN
jgi:hypothetical protein